MTTLLLIRHGDNDAVGKIIAGWMPGWHLNEIGKRQVAELGARLARLPLRAIYTSPLERAAETAEAVARHHGLAPQVFEDLGEVHFGEWEGLSIAELEQRGEWRLFNQHRSRTRIPNGETMLEVQTRMINRIDSLAKQHPTDTIAIVSHGDPLRATVAFHLGIPLDLLLRFEIYPASVTVLQAAVWGTRVLCVNHTGELPL